ncbi:unnamed protein product [Heligmosomoides polygyrus]|uniref:BZIP domain-containing protein n=1 Tax=Heligmosomoides polygyrus TaxID=6339 RepID=A0A183GUC9_HELPZ|nr:unnamed protein product [Heligmosomoides polygyrus]
MTGGTPPRQPQPESPFWPLEGLSMEEQLRALNVQLNHFQPGSSQYVLESPFWPLEGLSMEEQLRALNVQLNHFQPGSSQYVLPIHSHYLRQIPPCFFWRPIPPKQASTQTAPPQPEQRSEPDHPIVRMCPPSPPLPPLPLNQQPSTGISAGREGFWWNPTSRRETGPQAAPTTSAPVQQAPLAPAEQQPPKKCLGCGLDDHHIAFCAHNRQAIRDLSNERCLRHMRRARRNAFIARRLKEESEALLERHMELLDLNATDIVD